MDSDTAITNGEWIKKKLSERDICTQYITPAIVKAGWDLHRQVREEVSFTAGKIIVRSKLNQQHSISDVKEPL